MTTAKSALSIPKHVTTTAVAGQRVDVNPDAIPGDSKDLHQWVGWKWEGGGNKWTKPPYNAQAGKNAKTNDASTWCTFEEALTAYRKDQDIAGIGFVFTEGDPFIGVDLDHCRNPETGEVALSAQKIIAQLDSYTEVSPSRTGVKIWIKAKVPGKGKRTSCEDEEIEVYDRGQYFTVTGWHVEETPTTIEERQTELNDLYAMYFNDKQKSQASRKRSSAKSTTSGRRKSKRTADPPSAALNEKIENLRKSNPKFARTWQHDRPDMNDRSDSGYDLALASLTLADGWTDDEVEQLLLKHRCVNMAGDKADWPDYLRRTLSKARESGRPRSNGHSTRIEDAVIDDYFPTLTLKAQSIYIVLARHCDALRTCFLTYPTIIRKTGVSRNSVAKGLKELEERGLIERRPRKSSEGDWDTNEYFLPPLLRG